MKNVIAEAHEKFGPVKPIVKLWYQSCFPAISYRMKLSSLLLLPIAARAASQTAHPPSLCVGMTNSAVATALRNYETVNL
jgi:hypothetical protein